jgi:prepilin-type processing-associated H-X9-DG protein
MKTKTDGGGFTLVELLVVIAVTATLVALLLPSWAMSKDRGRGARCLSNLKQLTTAWAAYTSDNQGKLVPGGGEGESPSSPTDPRALPGGIYAQWCPGRQDILSAGVGSYLSPIGTVTNNLGYEWIQVGLIYPYVKNVGLYLCPADVSSITSFGIDYPHVRSISMNAWIQSLPLNDPTPPWNNSSEDSNLRVYTKDSDFTVPGPANTWVFIDENPCSINDAWFIIDPTDKSITAPQWIDCPANYHNGACGISFVDGHVQLKKWSDPAVLSVTLNGIIPSPSPWVSPVRPQSTNPNDILWLANRSTALKTTTSFQGPQ